MNPELLLTNSIEIRIIELDKVKKMYEKDRNNKKSQWILFLDDPNSEEVKEIMEENKDIKEATVTVRKMSEDEKLARLAELREKAIMDEKAIYAAGLERGEENGVAKGEKLGIEKGKKIGREEASREKSLEIAKELLQRGMSKQEVAEIVHIDIKELDHI